MKDGSVALDLNVLQEFVHLVV